MDIGEWMAPSVLEGIIKWAGVSVALAGAVLASPDGAKRLALGFWLWVRKLFGYRPQSATLNVPAIHSHLGATSSVEAELMWGPDSPLEHRINILLGRVDGLKANLKEAKGELSGRLDVHNQKIADLTRAIDEAQRSLHNRIDIKEEKAARIDAYGLPVIGLGIFLSGVPQELASVPWLGIPLTVFGVVLTIIVLVLGIGRGAWSGKLS